MLRGKNLWLIGGDARQLVLAGLLSDDGHRVHGFGLGNDLHCEPDLAGVKEADAVILPLPAMREEGKVYAPLSEQTLWMEDVLDHLDSGQLILAGAVSPSLHRMAQGRGLQMQDYYACEELALLNAIPTAEGAIRIAMETLPVTLHRARILLVGFGRVSQALAPRLLGLGARVTVAARRAEQRALADSVGAGGVPIDGMKEWLCGYDLVINTVPAPVFGVEELAALKEGTPVIDLASLPGGVDDHAARTLKIPVIHALALPGKEAPVTAARYLRDTVYHMMEG